MDILSYLAIWRRRWLLVFSGILLGVAGAVAVSALTQPLYLASARLFVTTTGGASVVETYQNNLFGQERVLSYAKLAAGRQVAQRSIDALHIQMSPEQLMSQVSAERVPLDTVLLDISVRNPNPDMARDLANTVARQTTQLVEELETSARGGIPAATAVLVDQAETPGVPYAPNWFRNILVGLLGGLLVGLIGAIARDKLDRSVRSTAQAADAAGTRSVGSVPPRPKRAAGIPFGASEPELTEAFRTVRTNLLAGTNGNAPSAVVVAEAGTKAGADTVTLGLGAALAESGRSVVVVDGNLRNDGLSQALGLGQRPGLCDVLGGSASTFEALVSTAVAGLTVLPCGQTDQDAGELLSNQDLTGLIKQLRSEYDFTLITGPPVLPYSDVVVMSGLADGVLLVARAGSTSKLDLAAAADKIRVAGAESLGVVVTNVKRA